MTCVESVSSAPLINAMDGYYIWIWVHPYSVMPVQKVGGELSGFWGSRDLSLREQLSPLPPNWPHIPRRIVSSM
jgi:hypothetical protein